MVAVHELPAGQRVQLAAPPVEKVPAAQAVQEVAPAELYSPAGHAEGDADCEGHSDPAGQREHVPPAGGGGEVSLERARFAHPGRCWDLAWKQEHMDVTRASLPTS